MKTLTRTTDWSEYSLQYDAMADNNPSYREILDFCIQTVESWQLPAGSAIADFGAGTGNLTVLLADRFRDLKIVHCDNNRAMMEIAADKKNKLHLDNLQILELDMDSENWPSFNVNGAIAINSLYTLKSPRMAIQRIRDRMYPGANILACDLGRKMNVLDWGIYMVGKSLSRNGLANTIKLFRETGLVRESNRRISNCQADGQYWMHDLDEFEQAFKSCGIKVSTRSSKFYRGYNDLIVGTRESSQV